MSTTKKPNRHSLTSTQMHDVWEISETDDITEEMMDILTSMGLTPRELDNAWVSSPKKEKDNG